MKVAALVAALLAWFSGAADAQGYSKERIQATVDRIMEPARKAHAACLAATTTAQETARYAADPVNSPPPDNEQKTKPYFDYTAARKAGVSDLDIVHEVGSHVGYDTQAALKAGFTPRQILNTLRSNYGVNGLPPDQETGTRMLQDAHRVCDDAARQFEESSRQTDAYFADLNRGLDAMERDAPRTTNCTPTYGGGFTCQTF